MAEPSKDEIQAQLRTTIADTSLSDETRIKARRTLNTLVPLANQAEDAMAVLKDPAATDADRQEALEILQRFYTQARED